MLFVHSLYIVHSFHIKVFTMLLSLTLSSLLCHYVNIIDPSDPGGSSLSYRPRVSDWCPWILGWFPLELVESTYHSHDDGLWHTLIVHTARPYTTSEITHSDDTVIYWGWALLKILLLFFERWWKNSSKSPQLEVQWSNIQSVESGELRDAAS